MKKGGILFAFHACDCCFDAHRLHIFFILKAPRQEAFLLCIRFLLWYDERDDMLGEVGLRTRYRSNVILTKKGVRIFRCSILIINFMKKLKTGYYMQIDV